MLLLKGLLDQRYTESNASWKKVSFNFLIVSIYLTNFSIISLFTGIYFTHFRHVTKIVPSRHITKWKKRGHFEMSGQIYLYRY